MRESGIASWRSGAGVLPDQREALRSPRSERFAGTPLNATSADAASEAARAAQVAIPISAKGNTGSCLNPKCATPAPSALPSSEPNTAPTDPHLLFTVHGVTYAMPLLSVREVMDLTRLTPVADAPEAMRGTQVLRGHRIPVVDLGAVLEERRLRLAPAPAH